MYTCIFTHQYVYVYIYIYISACGKHLRFNVLCFLLHFWFKLGAVGFTLEKPDACGSAQGIRQLLLALEDEFDTASRIGRGKKCSLSSGTIEHFRNAVNYQASRASEASTDLAATIGKKVGGRIAKVWFVKVGLVKVGLACPTIAARTLEDWCRDFSIVECPGLTHKDNKRS